MRQLLVDLYAKFVRASFNGGTKRSMITFAHKGSTSSEQMTQGNGTLERDEGLKNMCASLKKGIKKVSI